MTLPTINGHSIHVPGWAIAAAVLVVTLVATGFKVGAEYTDHQKSLENVELRLCRIEAAVQLEPWPGCPTNPRPGAGS